MYLAKDIPCPVSPAAPVVAVANLLVPVAAALGAEGLVVLVVDGDVVVDEGLPVAGLGL
jgi:hypothetical protein